jgi:hypothetical protein
VELTEAAAIWLAAPGQVDADASNEEEQQRERTKSTPPGSGSGYKGGGDGKLGQWQQDPERGRQRFRQTKVDDGLPRAGAVGEFGYASHDENPGEQQPCNE